MSPPEVTVDGLTPLGSELPFRREPESAGVTLASVTLVVVLPALFMLLIKSLTELFLESPEASVADGDEASLPAPTAVTSPDLRSTPTIDHGLGLGSGFGLGAEAGDTAEASVVALGEAEVELAEVEAVKARRPTMEPPFDSSSLSSPLVLVRPKSLVGDAKFPAKPVDLPKRRTEQRPLLVLHTTRENRTRINFSHAKRQQAT